MGLVNSVFKEYEYIFLFRHSKKALSRFIFGQRKVGWVAARIPAFLFWKTFCDNCSVLSTPVGRENNYRKKKGRHSILKLLILAEKPSQMKNYSKDLGGSSGTVFGDQYVLAKSHGHLLTLKAPQDQVDDEELKRKYADWTSLNNFPWNVHDFKWRKTAITGSRSTLATIKKQAKGKDAIVIATDNDPSGEGDLLAWEIIQAIGWKKKVFREYHEDEGKEAFLKALKNKEDVSSCNQQGRYLKALGRERFDFASMQLSRIATILAREAGYNVKVLRLGRLKSVIVALVYNQLLARERYVKKPYYEVRYRDNYGNVLKRKFNPDTDKWRWPTKKIADDDLREHYQPDDIVVDSKTTKTQQPPKLLNLSQLSIIMGRYGYSNKSVLATYQQMYQDQVVSYPRTEDTAVTPEQYQELLPYKDRIAKVVGVDPKLLTHLQPRKKHITKKAAHGANRPGTNVPASMSALESKYGKLGKLIYEQVAKAYLAILCEDYVYVQEKAHMASHPDFKGIANTPKQLNYKAVFDEDSLKDKNDDDEGPAKHGFAPMAAGFIYQGANPKPRKPTRGFILGYLQRNNIGNASTQVSTLSAVSEQKNSMLKAVKGSYELTELGWLCGFISQGTMIANPNTTKQILDLMKQVGDFKIKMQVIPNLMKQVVDHDLPVMRKNAAILTKDSNPIAKHIKAAKAQGGVTSKPKAVGEHNGMEIKFNKSWGGHTFTTVEVADLLAGKTIEFEFTKKNGEKKTVKGTLEKQTYKGHKFWGFKPQW